MTDEIRDVKSITLDDFLEKNYIDTKKYNHWVIDVQGAELDVFKGATKNLKFLGLNYCRSKYREFL